MIKHSSISNFIFIFFISVSLGYISCNNVKTNNTEIRNSATDIKVIESDSINPFVGAWKEPIPGQKEKYQGFILNKDGSAESINMATLKYISWKVDSNKIRFIVESIGNHISFIDTEFYSIESIDNSTMILKDEELTIKMKKKNE